MVYATLADRVATHTGIEEDEKMTYLFDTTATMKEYNRKKWWIDGDIIRQTTIKADNIEEALKLYKEYAYKSAFIEISNNAIKTKEPMYIDTENDAKQCGYVITAKADFQDSDNYKWSAQYIDLWVTIHIISSAFSGGVE